MTFDCTSNPATVDKARHNFMPKCIGSDEKMKVLFTHVEDYKLILTSEMRNKL